MDPLRPGLQGFLVGKVPEGPDGMGVGDRGAHTVLTQWEQQEGRQLGCGLGWSQQEPRALVYAEDGTQLVKEAPDPPLWPAESGW